MAERTTVEQRCENCKSWNDGKEFSDFTIGQQKKYGIGYDKNRCSKIDDFVTDPGYETEGVETSHDFGCILFEQKAVA